MARTIQEIQGGILATIASDQVLSTQLTSTSKVAIYRLFTFVVASAIWLLESIFDNHKKKSTPHFTNKNQARHVGIAI